MSTGRVGGELKDGYSAYTAFLEGPHTVDADGWEIISCFGESRHGEIVSDVSAPSTCHTSSTDELPKESGATTNRSLFEWLINCSNCVAYAQNDILRLELALKYERQKLKELQPKKCRKAARVQQAHVVQELEDRLCDAVRPAATEQARFINAIQTLLCNAKMQPLLNTVTLQEPKEKGDLDDERRTFHPFIQEVLSNLGEIDIARERIEDLQFSRAVEESVDKPPDSGLDGYATSRLQDQAGGDEALCGLETALRDAEYRLSASKAKCIAAGLDPDHEVARICTEARDSAGDSPIREFDEELSEGVRVCEDDRGCISFAVPAE